VLVEEGEDPPPGVLGRLRHVSRLHRRRELGERPLPALALIEKRVTGAGVDLDVVLDARLVEQLDQPPPMQKPMTPACTTPSSRIHSRQPSSSRRRASFLKVRARQRGPLNIAGTTAR
jgi:hypothetical protein